MKKFKRFVALLCALVMAVALCVPNVQAYAANTDAINEAKSGLITVQVVYVDSAGDSHTIQSGTAFFINENHVLTCWHVTHLDDETKAAATEAFGVDFVNSTPSGLQLEVVVRRDMTITATELNGSEEADFAILELSQNLYDRTYLALGDSDDVVEAEDIYVLGYPSIADAFSDANIYDSDDVNVTSGVVSKQDTENAIPYIKHSAVTTFGDSGGPLLNAEGQVIGMNQDFIYQVTEVEDSDGTVRELITYTYRAVAINEIKPYLDALGISYNTVESTSGSDETEVAADSEEESQAAAADEEETVDKSSLSTLINSAKSLDADEYTKDSYEDVEDALESAQSVYDDDSATQTDVDNAKSSLQSAIDKLETAQGISMVMIIVIVAIVVVVIIVIIIIIAVSSSKKKKKKLEQQRQQQRPQPQAPGPRPQQPPYGQPQPAPQPQYQAPPQPQYQQPQPRPYTPPQPEGAGETTVLNSGAGETTVLGGQPSAILRRVKTGETISVNKQTFTIGKERRRVDYCISDNTSISRAHAQIICKGGEYYVVDQGSTNFTFVNGNKIPAHQEVKLNSGDKVKLSDEEFEFRI